MLSCIPTGGLGPESGAYLDYQPLCKLNPATRNMMAYSRQELAPAELHCCALPGRGRFEPLLSNEQKYEVPARAGKQQAEEPKLCASELRNGEQGVWISSSEWRPAGCEATHQIASMPAIAACLRGRALIFRGDSLTRQLFMRLVWRLRGLPTIVEHYFHSSAVYVFEGLNAGEATPTDELAILNTQRAQWFQRQNDHPVFRGEPRELEALLRNRLRPNGFLLIMLRGELGNWSSEFNSSGLIAGIVSGRFSQMKVGWWAPAARKWREDSLNLDVMNAGGGAPHWFSRNRIDVVRSQWNVSRGKQLEPLLVQGGMVDHKANLDPPAKQVHILRSRDAHFQCSWEPRWPNHIRGFKMPLNGDCRDLISLNAVLAIVNRICA